MKNLLLMLLFCLPSFLSAQSNSKIELLGGLDYTYRDHTNSGWIQSLRKSEKGKINTHFGINYFQKLKPRLWLKIGIGFVSLGYKTAKTELNTGSGATGGTQDPLLQGLDNPTSQFIYNYHFLEVPFSIHLDFFENKLKPFVELGIAPMYYIQSITKHKLGDEIRSKRNEQEDFINDFQFATTVAFGFSYSFNEKWEMVVQPNFRYHLSKIADAPVKEHLWSTGLAIGMRMAMK
ncbi:MAG: acyloxyacyl hydrolase [Saprospiraceae bacterium]